MSGSYRAFLRHLHIGEPVSGAKIAADMGVSRVAVWKAMESLRKRGVKIAAGRDGYLLEEPADLLFPDDLERLFAGARIGHRVLYREQADSTQDMARKAAEGGCEDGTLVVAETQTSGRGRLGRRWDSDRGGLWFTVVIRPRGPPSVVQVYSYMASLSVREAVAELVPERPWLKWPNDVFIGGRKLSGVLTEVAASTDEVRYVLVGVGLNVNNPVGSVGEAYSATSVKEAAGRFVDRNDLLASVLSRMNTRYEQCERDGPAAVIGAYRRSCSTIGKKVRVAYGDGSMEGLAVGIDETGALEVRSGGRLTKVHSGDVTHLRVSAGG
ncbi:MAG TPA: biotin--[acetyl-CoA-carboxylase] ligase [Conexivisphaerales archaeon]|nr:biotin--[acetyl-CoA-carboxylase] ligase [Conexivisphaerales archaeon]